MATNKSTVESSTPALLNPARTGQSVLARLTQPGRTGASRFPHGFITEAFLGDDQEPTDETETHALDEAQEFSKKAEERVELTFLSDEELETLAMSYREGILRKQQARTLEGANLLPFIDRKARKLTLPEPENDDDLLGYSMLAAAHLLGYKVKLIEYTKKLKVLSEDESVFRTGLAFFVADISNKINLTRVKSKLEMGRKCARALQISAMFDADKKLTAGALSSDNFWFGNNPDETMVLGSSEIPVSYIGKQVDQIITQEEWAKELGPIYKGLIRETSTLLTEEVAHKSVEEGIVSPRDYILKHASKTVVLTPAKGKRKALKKSVVASKPQPSSLLTKSENLVITRLLDPIFKDNLPSSKEGLIAYCMENSFATFKKAASDAFKIKVDVLARFGAFTTKRLNALRELSANRSLRKKDVTSVMVSDLLSRRDDPLASFVRELTLLDPRFDDVFSAFKTGTNNDAESPLDFTASEAKLRLFVQGLYELSEEITKKAEQYKAQRLAEKQESADRKEAADLDKVIKRAEARKARLEKLTEAQQLRLTEEATYDNSFQLLGEDAGVEEIIAREKLKDAFLEHVNNLWNRSTIPKWVLRISKSLFTFYKSVDIEIFEIVRVLVQNLGQVLMTKFSDWLQESKSLDFKNMVKALNFMSGEPYIVDLLLNGKGSFSKCLEEFTTKA